MNTWRVSIRLKHWNVPRLYDVDAARPGEAIRRALVEFPDSPDVAVECHLYAKGITRHYSAPKVRAV